MSTRALPPTAGVDAQATLGQSLERVLGGPLAALRASIEALVGDLDEGDPRGRTLEGALAQVAHMTRDLRCLVDFAAPRPLAPLRCSFEEIARGVVGTLGADLCGRLQIAYPPRGAAFTVDGPLLITCLSSLAQGALESAPGNLLLQARRERELVVFTFVLAGAIGRAFPASDASLAMRVDVARRDIARMGGSLCAQHTERGLTCLSVLLPDRRAEFAP
jgi:hypothetical protein